MHAPELCPCCAQVSLAMWCAAAHARHATARISADRCVPCTQIILEVSSRNRSHNRVAVGLALTTSFRLPWQEAAYCDPGLVRPGRCCLMARVSAHPPRLRAQVAEVVVPLLSMCIEN